MYQKQTNKINPKKAGLPITQAQEARLCHSEITVWARFFSPHTSWREGKCKMLFCHTCSQGEGQGTFLGCPTPVPASFQGECPTHSPWVPSVRLFGHFQDWIGIFDPAHLIAYLDKVSGVYFCLSHTGVYAWALLGRLGWVVL